MSEAPDKVRERMARRRLRVKMRDDVCQRCGTRPPREGFLHCERCTAIHRRDYDRNVAPKMGRKHRCSRCGELGHNRVRCARVRAA